MLNFLAVTLVFILLFGFASIAVDRLVGIRHREQRWRVTIHHALIMLYGFMLVTFGMSSWLRFLAVVVTFAIVELLSDLLLDVHEGEYDWRTMVHHIPYFLFGCAMTLVCAQMFA